MCNTKATAKSETDKGNSVAITPANNRFFTFFFKNIILLCIILNEFLFVVGCAL